MATKGYSLHVGVNHVDPRHYGKSMDLPSCENDAQFMMEVARKFGYQKSIMLPYTDKKKKLHRPTSAELKSIMEEYSKKLKAGDIFLFTYSGHGGQISDKNTVSKEDDGFHETYCLYDRQLIDDEIHQAFCKFKSGVRILVFLDSCHSGTGTKQVNLHALLTGAATEVDTVRKEKSLPVELNDSTNTKNAAIYTEVAASLSANPSHNLLKASVKQFSAVQDNQVAFSGPHLSLFTQDLKNILQRKPFPQNYDKLFEAIRETATIEQTPNYFRNGPTDEAFEKSIPFTYPGVELPEDIVEESVLTQSIELLVDFEGELVDTGTVVEAIGKGFEVEKLQTKDGSTGKQTSASLVLKGNIDEGTGEKAWDLAYRAFQQFQGLSKEVFIEPNASQKLHVEPTRSKAANSGNTYMPTWPAPKMNPEPPKNEFVWHLDDDHSQLASARDELLQLPAEERRVRIAHIDTGYAPEHPSMPENMLKDLGKSFVSGEENNKGIEIWDNAKIEQDGHGMATLAILAGNKVNKEESYGHYEGYLGAVPFAEIVPIRIADSVALIFDTKTFADAIHYAIEQKCDVVTMSMAGMPSRKWAKAINAAYEAGVTVVTAAGNNWRKGFKKILPKVVLYPSRFERVISATGVCVNQEPYDFEANSHQMNAKTAGGENMQGNWGPRSTMLTAVAGYTPNVPWAVINQSDKYSRSGGGTSSATPQVAATAALWIAKHRQVLEAKGYAGTWKQVEAVRQAIFNTADKSYFAYDQYYGNGAIKAKDALNHPVAEIKEHHKSPRAKIFFVGITEFLLPFLQSVIKSGDAGNGEEAAVSDKLMEMAGLEIIQLLYQDPSLFYYSKHLNLEDDGPLFENAGQMEAFRRKLKASDAISSFLKQRL